MNQNAFTDDDIKDMQNFLQFVRDKARFELDWAESVQLAKYYQFMQQMIRKAHDHVMELKKVHEPESESKPKPRTKKAKGK